MSVFTDSDLGHIEELASGFINSTLRGGIVLPLDANGVPRLDLLAVSALAAARILHLDVQDNAGLEAMG